MPEPAGGLAGRLLVADPQLLDPNFRRTVVLILAHGDEGALGVVLNRPAELAVARVLDRWANRAAEPDVLFTGGPVELDALIALGRAADAAATTGSEDEELLPGVGVVDLSADPDSGQEATVAAVRIFRGYAGWEVGQLETEIERGDWHVVGAEPGDVFCERPEDLWRTVLSRQRGVLAVLATYPEHPWLN